MKYDDAIEYAINMINYSKKMLLYNQVFVWDGDIIDEYPIPERCKIVLQWDRDHPFWKGSDYGNFWMDETRYLKEHGKLSKNAW